MHFVNLEGPETLQHATQKLAGTTVLLKLICILENPSLSRYPVSAHLWVALEFAGESLIGVFHNVLESTVTNSADAAEADQQGLLCVLMVQLLVPVMCQNTKKQDVGADVCASLMLLGLPHSSLYFMVASEIMRLGGSTVPMCFFDCPPNYL